MLGEVAEAKAVVDASVARGDFAGDAGKTFPGQLGHDLKAWGYLADPAAIGLTDSPAPAPARRPTASRAAPSAPAERR